MEIPAWLLSDHITTLFSWQHIRMCSVIRCSVLTIGGTCLHLRPICLDRFLQANKERPNDPCRNYDVTISLSSHPPPPQTHTDTCLRWQIACDVPLQTRHGSIHSLSLGLTAAESSSGQDAPVSALAAASTPRQSSYHPIRWGEKGCVPVWRKTLDASRSLNQLHKMNERLFKHTCGAKGGAAAVDPAVLLIPQMQKFTQRSNRR